MGLGEWQQHMPFQLLLIYQVLMLFTPHDSQPLATCGVRQPNQPVFIVYMPHVRMGWPFEPIHTLLIPLPIFLFQGHTVWQRLEQEIWVLSLGQIPFHACCGSATWPLWLPVSAKSRRVRRDTPCSRLFGLTLLRVAAVPQGKSLSAIWMGMRTLICMWNNPEPLQYCWYVLLLCHPWEIQKNAVPGKWIQ